MNHRPNISTKSTCTIFILGLFVVSFFFPLFADVKLLVCEIIVSLSELKSLLVQGLNYVAALLLLVMKTEEDAFWMLAVLLENVLVNDCYTNNLSGCHVEQRVFKDLLAKKCPRYSHFYL